MSLPATKSPYAGYRFPPEVISQAVWLYFRFPFSLRMVEEMLAVNRTRYHRQPRGRAAVGAQLRPGLRQPDLAALPATGDKQHAATSR
jgi:putative transposase